MLLQGAARPAATNSPKPSARIPLDPSSARQLALWLMPSREPANATPRPPVLESSLRLDFWAPPRRHCHWRQGGVQAHKRRANRCGRKSSHGGAFLREPFTFLLFPLGPLNKAALKTNAVFSTNYALERLSFEEPAVSSHA
jgi:hypothetical protein